MPTCLNAESCPCPKTNCERHGRCCACVKHHMEHKEKPVVHCLKYKVKEYREESEQ